MARVSINNALVFPGGFFIFRNTNQVDPKSPQGKKIVEILARQKKENKDHTPQKYRAEVIHKKDINADGFIGDPVDKVKAPVKKKRKSRFSL